jgi:hypothetical protein
MNLPCTVLAASDLPKLRKFFTVEYYIAIQDGKDERKTRTVISTDLKWGESFDLQATSSFLTTSEDSH